MRNTRSIQIQCELLDVLVRLEEAKEYDAPWLEEAQKVYRDAKGRFTTKDVDVADENEEFSLEDLGESAKAHIAAWSADSENSLSVVSAATVRKGLEKFVEDDVDNAKKFIRSFFDKTERQTREAVAKAVGLIDKGIAKTMGEHPLEDIKDSILEGTKPEDQTESQNIVGKLATLYEVAGNRYIKAIDELKNTEDDNKAKELSGKAVGMTAPVALSLAASLGPGIALGKMRGDSMFNTLINSATSLAWGTGADAVIDPDNDENPITDALRRAAISVGATSGMMDIRALKFLNYKKGAKKAKELVKQLGNDDIPDPPEKGGKVIFTTSGIDGDQQELAKKLNKVAKDRASRLPLLGKSKFVSTMENEEREFFGRNPFFTQWSENLDAPKVAAKVYAYLQKNPGQYEDIALFGYSAGGVIGNDAMNILKEMGVDVSKIKAVNLGSPRLLSTKANRNVTNIKDTWKIAENAENTGRLEHMGDQVASLTFGMLSGVSHAVKNMVPSSKGMSTEIEHVEFFKGMDFHHGIKNLEEAISGNQIKEFDEAMSKVFQATIDEDNPVITKAVRDKIKEESARQLDSQLDKGTLKEFQDKAPTIAQGFKVYEKDFLQRINAIREDYKLLLNDSLPTEEIARKISLPIEQITNQISNMESLYKYVNSLKKEAGVAPNKTMDQWIDSHVKQFAQSLQDPEIYNILTKGEDKAVSNLIDSLTGLRQHIRDTETLEYLTNAIARLES